MRVNSLTIVFVAVSLNLSVFACPFGDVVGGQSSNPTPLTFATLKPKVIAELQKKHPGLKDIIVRPHSSYENTFIAELVFGNHTIATTDTAYTMTPIRSGVYSFEIEVQNGFRGAGLAKLMHAYITEKFGEDFQTAKTQLSDKNLEVFLRGVETNESKQELRAATLESGEEQQHALEHRFRERVYELKPGESARELRERIIESIRDKVPSSRNLRDFGFNRIEYVDIIVPPKEFEDAEVRVIYGLSRGGRRQEKEIEMTVFTPKDEEYESKTPHFFIRPDGSIVRGTQHQRIRKEFLDSD